MLKSKFCHTHEHRKLQFNKQQGVPGCARRNLKNITVATNVTIVPMATPTTVPPTMCGTQLLHSHTASVTAKTLNSFFITSSSLQI